VWSNACACVHASVVCVFTCVQCVCVYLCAVCVCVCMCVCVCVCVCVYVCVCVCVCVCMFKILNSSVLNTCMAIVCVAGSLKLNCMFY